MAGSASVTPTERVEELLQLYGSPDACAAELLCDRHDPAARAYRVIGPDFTPEDISYAELRDASERFAAALAAIGIVPGDRVATLMGKSREYLVALMGIWRLGAVHVPLFTAFAPPAIAFRLIGSGAKAVICDEGQRHKLAPGDDIPADAAWQVIVAGPASGGALSFAEIVAAQQPGFAAARLGGDAPIIHVYTSGTTGNPKGVVVPMRALASFRIYAEYGQGVVPSDVFWCGADPGWAYGLYFGILATFTTGTPSILLQGGFTPEATMRVLEQERVTNFAAAPTVYRALRSSGLRPSAPLALRCLSSAGEPLTPEVNSWAEELLGLTVYDHYGQTEAGMLINNHHHPDVRRPVVPGSMGQAMPGWRAVILDAELDQEVPTDTFGRVAMVVADSPLCWFKGYGADAANRGDKFTADGRYYLTGDTASLDKDGYFRFSARDDDVIIMAGYRIGPFEVESSLATHPSVAESAVIAVPDEVRGEVIEAYVVLEAGQSPSPELARDIQNWVKTRYAAHAYPRQVHFIASMPKTPSGKIQRFVLKQRRLSELDLKA
jgi:acetyl-CoA synthetase